MSQPRNENGWSTKDPHDRQSKISSVAAGFFLVDLPSSLSRRYQEWLRESRNSRKMKRRFIVVRLVLKGFSFHGLKMENTLTDVHPHFWKDKKDRNLMDV